MSPEAKRLADYVYRLPTTAGTLQRGQFGWRIITVDGVAEAGSIFQAFEEAEMRGMLLSEPT